MRPRKPIDFNTAPSEFTEENIQKMAKELGSGKLKLPRVQWSDDLVTGLRVMINKSGLITWHTAYTIGESRPLLKIGSFNKGDKEFLTLEDARHLTKVIQTLARRGTDVQESLHRRLIAELKRDGVNWEGAMAPPPSKRRGA